MELADGGDVQSKIDSQKKKGGFVPESEIWDIIRQAL
jgi:hypothetical protein